MVIPFGVPLGEVIIQKIKCPPSWSLFGGSEGETQLSPLRVIHEARVAFFFCLSAALFGEWAHCLANESGQRRRESDSAEESGFVPGVRCSVWFASTLLSICVSVLPNFARIARCMTALYTVA